MGLKRYFLRLVKISFLLFLTTQLLVFKYLPSLALNDTTKTWNFTTATAGDYTYDSNLVSVDDSGAHPVAGVNKITNPSFSSDNSSWNVAAIPPSGWIEVPGDSNFGTSNFLVMKYEAKCALTSDPTTGLTSPSTSVNTYADSTTACTSANSRQVVSVASGYPIGTTLHDTAKSRCSSISLGSTTAHLLTNDEYMTIARNAEAQGANWTGGSVGSGYLYAGHNDNSPSLARIASTTDTGNYRCAYTDGNPGTEAPSTCPTYTSSGQSASVGNQVRTFTLSNGYVIWDIAGNVWEEVQRSSNNSGDNTNTMNLPTCSNNTAGFTWCEYSSTASPYVTAWTTDVVRDLVGPSDTTYNSSQGVGMVYTYGTGGNQGTNSFLRGGRYANTTGTGAFALALSDTTNSPDDFVGFRCASDSVNISQTWSSSSGKSGGGNTVTIGNVTDGKIYQSINVGESSTYDFSVFVYDNTSGNVGGTVNSSIAQLYYNGSAISTTYTDAGDGWWKLSGTLTSANEAREYGLLVKAGKTIKVDDFTLSKQGNYTIYNTTAYNPSSLISWDSFSDSVSASGNAKVYYQICLDDGSVCSYSSGSRWQYYSGGTWVNAVDETTAYANTSSQLTQTAMQSLSVTSRKISFKAIMVFGGSDTPTISSITIGLTTDATAPSISLNPLSPDPNSNNIPTLSGTASESIGTVSSVQFQMDSTSGSWSSCTADDGAFDEATEAFSCTPATALSDGSHTMYVRATDSNSNTTASGSESSDTFTIDTTAPTSIDLDSPGDNSYTNNERPTFKWKATSDATAGLSKYALEIDNPSLSSANPSGDFTIDDIPTSRTTDYETNKYLVHYENFSDSDSTNNYISVYTKSSTEWSSDSNSGQNDGKLREGRVSWKVKAVDNAGNETSSSRTLFVDRTKPSVEITQLNDFQFSIYNFKTNNNNSIYNFQTTDKTPTIYGKITDPLAGGDSSQTQDKNGPKIASGPKEVEIRFEKRNYLGVYTLYALAKVNINELYWTSDGTKITDNSKQVSDKYSSFSYTPKSDLPLGTYKITLTAKDLANNSSSEVVLTLNVTTFDKITVPEEIEVSEKETKLRISEEKERVKKKLEVTQPTQTPKPSFLEKFVSTISETLIGLWRGVVDAVKMEVNVLADIWNNYQVFVIGINQRIIGFIRISIHSIAKEVLTIGHEVAKTISNAYNKTLNNTPNPIKAILTRIGKGVILPFRGIRFLLDRHKADILEAYGVYSRLAEKIVSEVARVRLVIAHAFGPSLRKLQLRVAIIQEYWFDKKPTRILVVRVEEVTPTSAVIFWQTNHHSSSIVNYGFNTSYDKKIISSEKVKEHFIKLTGLEPGETYFFEVISQNKNYFYDTNHTFSTPSTISGQVSKSKKLKNKDKSEYF